MHLSKLVLLTGGTGFIGSYIIDALLERGYLVRCLVRESSVIDRWEGMPGISFVTGDLTKPETLVNIAADVDYVIHLAAAGHVSSVSEESFKKFVAINETGTRNLIDACKAVGCVKKFIHFSSTAAMGPIGNPILDENSVPNPVTPYQKSKLCSEWVVRDAWENAGFPGLILRPCMVYGIGGLGAFHRFYDLMKKSRFPRVGLGRKLTPMVYVSDVAQAAMKALEKGRPGESYIIASETSFPMDTIRKLIIQNAQVRAFYPYIPGWAALAMGKMLEVMYTAVGKEPIVTYRNINSTIVDRTFDIRKAKMELGYEPQMRVEEGIRKTIEWYKKNNF